MNFLLAIPRWASRPGDYYDFPLGVAYVSSALKGAGFKVLCCNLNHVEGSLAEELQGLLLRHDIDVFCMGGGSSDLVHIQQLFQFAKQLKPSLITVLGGAIFTSEPELMLRSLPVDIGIIGEGEATIVELARALEAGSPLGHVKGIAFVGDAQNVVITDPRPIIDDLDSIAFPDYEGFGMDECLRRQTPLAAIHLYPVDTPRCIPMTLSRSCPFKCTFCYHPLGDAYRSRSLDNFFAELDSLRTRYDFNMIAVNDDLLSSNRARLMEFCRRLAPYGLKWMAQLRVDKIDAELLRVLKKSGCHLIGYGIESAHDGILRSMNKKITVAQIEKALALTREAGIGIQGNLIFGDPEETATTALATLDWWLAHVEYQLNLSFVMAFPGSKIYGDVANAGKIDKLRFMQAGCPPFNISKMTAEEYTVLHEAVRQLRVSQRRMGRVLRLRRSTTHRHPQQAVFAMTVGCPHCHETTEYDNVIPTANWYKGYDSRVMKIGCRHCNQRIDLDSSMFEATARSAA
jgi:radical SAM superfamily enzyme YgiQ (UPF0313 family)